MTTRHLVDPELRPFIDMVTPLDLTSGNLAVFRERLAAFAAGPFAAPDVAVRTVEATEAQPRLLVIDPVGDHAHRPAILHIHGGGFIGGLPEAVAERNVRWARELQAVIVSVDYRKAPEHRFPAALDDCRSGLAWLQRHAAHLRIDTNAIALMGESAGGGLAASLALHERDRGASTFCLQLLNAPMLDDRTAARTAPNALTGEYVWTRVSNVFGWRSYLGVEPGSASVDPAAVPARAESLSDLPPTYIETAALDLFVEEDIAFAARLVAAGVPLELHVYPGAFHGFQRVVDAAVTRRSEANCLSALRRAFVASSFSSEPVL